MLHDLKRLRRSLDLTQAEMAKKLGITRNYLALMETGRRNIPAHVQDLVETLLRGVQPFTEAAAGGHEDPAPYGCRLPADCDLTTELKQMRAEMADMRGKLDTLLGLLGGPLRASIGLDEDETNPGKRAG